MCHYAGLHTGYSCYLLVFLLPEHRLMGNLFSTVSVFLFRCFCFQVFLFSFSGVKHRKKTTQQQQKKLPWISSVFPLTKLEFFLFRIFFFYLNLPLTLLFSIVRQTTFYPFGICWSSVRRIGYIFISIHIIHLIYHHYYLLLITV